MKENTPIIVGIADVLDKTDELSEAKETLTLIYEALEKAALDTGNTAILKKLDQIAIVNVFSWPYPNICKSLSKLLPENPSRKIFHGPVGGESPLRFINQMAQGLARGEYKFAAVCGGEAQRSAQRALRRNAIPAHWTQPDLSQMKSDLSDWVSEKAKRYGLTSPIAIYPFYENRMYGKYGQDFKESTEESAQIWSNLSNVAAQNPYAWIPEEKSVEEICTVNTNNRMIAFPYPKFMIANNSVNSSSAVLMTTVKQARKLKIPQQKWIYVGAGAAAHEPQDFLKRDNYYHSAAMEAVLKKVLEFNDIEVEELDYTELYSCFPCVPKMARRILGMKRNQPMTVIGGLTFAGAALNNYMTSASTGMVRKLREKGNTGLLYGNGEFVTKNHALVLHKSAPSLKTVLIDYDVQEVSDELRGAIPDFIEVYEGPAILETYTVIYDRKGPKNAVVIGRTPDQKRFVSRVPLKDKEAIDTLLNPNQSLFGKAGVVCRENRENQWRFSKETSLQNR